jgi:hypothetical protein
MTASGNERGDVAGTKGKGTHAATEGVTASSGSMRRCSVGVHRVTRMLLVFTGVFAGMLLWSRLKIVSETPRSVFADPKAERAGLETESAHDSSSRSMDLLDISAVHNELEGVNSDSDAASIAVHEGDEVSQVDENNGLVAESRSGSPQ